MASSDLKRRPAGPGVTASESAYVYVAIPWRLDPCGGAAAYTRLCSVLRFSGHRILSRPTPSRRIFSFREARAYRAPKETMGWDR